MFFDRVAFDLLERLFGGRRTRGLNESTSNYTWHKTSFALSQLRWHVQGERPLPPGEGGRRPGEGILTLTCASRTLSRRERAPAPLHTSSLQKSQFTQTVRDGARLQTAAN